MDENSSVKTTDFGKGTGNMKATALTENSLYKKQNQADSILCKSKARWTAALFISAVLGVSSGLTGLIISGLSLSGFLENTGGIRSLGSWLVAAAFPLLMLVAHCLDKIGAADKAIKLEYCRQHGFKDEDCGQTN